MSEWKTIESAPKDGAVVLATWAHTWANGNPHIEAVETSESGDWFYSFDGDAPQDEPTHWMPLPEPPK